MILAITIAMGVCVITAMTIIVVTEIKEIYQKDK